MMRILRAADHLRMPWKNGGGETTEICVMPPYAALDAFDWRVSMAKVARDGPFSTFPGIDRSLAILDGEGLRLAIEGRAPVDLGPHADPHAFPADVATAATLLGGPVTDLNVMTRRGRARHRMRRCEAGHRPIDIAIDSATASVLLFCHRGAAAIAAPDPALHIGPLDALFVAAERGSWQIRAAPGSQMFLIEIETLAG